MSWNDKDVKDKSALAEQTKSQSVEAQKLDLDASPIQFKQADGSLAPYAHDKNYMELILRSGKHSDLVKKIIRQRLEARANEFPRWPASPSGGVRVMWIESRFWYDRERLLPDFDDDWRRYRARYLHSLELDPREPVHVPEYERQFLNPIRRFYMKGGDFLEDKIIRKFTKKKFNSTVARILITRGLMAMVAGSITYYWIRYNHFNWTSHMAPKVNTTAPILFPGDPGYPYKDWHKVPHDYHDAGFSRRKVFTDLRDYEDTTTVL